ncbi:MAG: hypothetical protein V2A62_00665 [Candidatus Woesearchaeota archaeon]
MFELQPNLWYTWERVFENKLDLLTPPGPGELLHTIFSSKLDAKFHGGKFSLMHDQIGYGLDSVERDLHGNLVHSPLGLPTRLYPHHSYGKASRQNPSFKGFYFFVSPADPKDLFNSNQSYRYQVHLKVLGVEFLSYPAVFPVEGKDNSFDVSFFYWIPTGGEKGKLYLPLDPSRLKSLEVKLEEINFG